MIKCVNKKKKLNRRMLDMGLEVVPRNEKQENPYRGVWEK